MNTPQLRPEIKSLSTLVVKVGSRILTSGADTPDAQRIGGLVDAIASLREAGIRTLLVSSGAIAHGMRALGLKKRPKTIPMKQACAAIGQIRLMHEYETHFSRHGILIGQVLLTWDDLRNKKRYLNLRNTLCELFDRGAIPIVNENDSVGVEEIRFGENDTLAAQIALLIRADVFVNLTDINGLFDADPRVNGRAAHIPLVERLGPAVFKYAAGGATEISVGGMITKLRAAEIATRAGVCALIGDGFSMTLLDVLKDPAAGTLFLPSGKPMPSKRRWIAFTGQSSGEIIIDEGAVKAIVERGKSLLPAGIREVRGSFGAGAMVDVKSQVGHLIGRGLVNYSSAEVETIIGCKTEEIARRLGGKRSPSSGQQRELSQKPFDEVIHRNNLVIV